MKKTAGKDSKANARREILTGYFFNSGSAGLFSQELLSPASGHFYFK